MSRTLELPRNNVAKKAAAKQKPESEMPDLSATPMVPDLPAPTDFSNPDVIDAATVTREITVAYAEPTGYDGPRQLSLTLYGKNAQTIHRLYCGLNQAHVTKNDGSHIDSHADVIRYLMEQLVVA